MLEQPVAVDGDHIEAHALQLWTLGELTEPKALSCATHALLFLPVHALRSADKARSAPRSDFHDNNNGAIERYDIDLEAP